MREHATTTRRMRFQYDTPSFRSAGGGHPFHVALGRFPRYWRSSTPILLDQNPDAVKFRKLLKKRTPVCISGRARRGQAMSSSIAVCCTRSHSRNGFPKRPTHSASSHASPERIHVRIPLFEMRVPEAGSSAES